MFKTIMVPVDLAHANRMERATTAAADLAKPVPVKLHTLTSKD